MDADVAPFPEFMPSLAGKVALVTGTTSGIGVRFARVLAKAGAAVALTGRRIDRLEAVQGQIKNEGGNAISIPFDITSASDIMRVVADTERRLGPTDILVNNAGINIPCAAVDLSTDDFDLVWRTNVSGAFFMSQQVAKRMIERGKGGQIINIASTGGHTVVPGFATYCTTKAAMVMMTKSLAHEWAPHNINVNALCPGYIRTDINDEWLQTDEGLERISGFPRRRVGDVSDMDDVLLMLSSGRSRLITGAIITIDDGQSL
jgi:NAD(P)-dependent dehydrogenase (short-subunit alcohol dehydrogenase family)